MSEYGELVVGDEKVETGGEHKDWRKVLQNAERITKKNEWIDVKDHLPDENGFYRVLIDACDREFAYFFDGIWDTFDHITHWMSHPKD